MANTGIFGFIRRCPETFLGVDVREAEIRLAGHERQTPGPGKITTVRVRSSSLEDALSEGMEMLGLPAGTHAAAALESRRVVVRQTSLPPMPEKEIEAALSYQLPQLIPGYADGWTYGWVRMGSSKERDPQEYLVAALPRPVTLEYHAGFAGAGLRLVSLEVRPLAVWRFLFGKHVGAEPQGQAPSLAVIDPDGESADMAVFEGGVLRYARMLTGWAGGDSEEKRVSGLVSEIRRSLLWYRHHHHGNHPEKLLVTVTGSVGGLGTVIADQLGMNTVDGRPDWLNRHSFWTDGFAPEFSAAAGLALKEAIKT